jgi:hypothetical protein
VALASQTPEQPENQGAAATVAREEREMTSFEHATIRLAWLAFFVSLVGAYFVALQWHAMHAGSADTHDLAVSAGKQAAGMKKLADRMKDQAAQTKVLAIEAKTQAIAANIAAKAAESAARTAKEALYVSQRAYLTLGFPQNDFPHHRMEVAIINGGHIPSGPATIIVHEATYGVDDVTTNYSSAFGLIESHWQKMTDSSIPVFQNGPFYQVDVHFPKLVETDLNAGKQSIITVLVMTYNDGFPGRPKAKFDFL